MPSHVFDSRQLLLGEEEGSHAVGWICGHCRGGGGIWKAQQVAWTPERGDSWSQQQVFAVREKDLSAELSAIVFVDFYRKQKKI